MVEKITSCELDEFVAYLDVDFSVLLAEGLLHQGGADVLAGRRRRAARADHTDDIAFGVAYLVTVARDAAVDHLEAYDFLAHAIGFLGSENFAVEEVIAVDELGDPA